MNRARHLRRSPKAHTAARAAYPHRCFIFFFGALICFNIHKSEEFQEAINIGICGVNPELGEFVRAGFLRIKYGYWTFGAVAVGLW